MASKSKFFRVATEGATTDGRKIERSWIDQMGKNFDPAMFESPEVRFAVLEMLINQRLLAGKAADEKFRVTDAQLQQVIAGIPAFQEDGRFSPDRYRQLLTSQNMTPPSRVRRTSGVQRYSSSFARVVAT